MEQTVSTGISLVGQWSLAATEIIKLTRNRWERRDITLPADVSTGQIRAQPRLI